MSQNSYKLTGRTSLASQGDTVKLCANSEKDSAGNASRLLRAEILDCQGDSGSFECAETSDFGASTTTNCVGSKEALRVTGRGCSHCQRRAELLELEETRPETYRCPVCKARWIFLSQGLLDAVQLESELVGCNCGKCTWKDAEYGEPIFVSVR